MGALIMDEAAQGIRILQSRPEPLPQGRGPDLNSELEPQRELNMPLGSG